MGFFDMNTNAVVLLSLLFECTYLVVYWGRHTSGQTNSFLHLQHCWRNIADVQMVYQATLWPANNVVRHWWCQQCWHFASGTKTSATHMGIKYNTYENKIDLILIPFDQVKDIYLLICHAVNKYALADR